MWCETKKSEIYIRIHSVSIQNTEIFIELLRYLQPNIRNKSAKALEVINGPHFGLWTPYRLLSHSEFNIALFYAIETKI